VAAEEGLVLIAPDTSPRGANLAGETDAWDFGAGAGFYVDATEAPWSRHYRMYSYILELRPAGTGTGIDAQRTGIFGHSMGGHGALVLACAIRNCSAQYPPSPPSPRRANVRGAKSVAGYLGSDAANWQQYDASALMRGLRPPRCSRAS
jgi:S-formylglutathione hydrolase